MPIKPSPTIAGKLRKLFNNNKQTIEPAIGDSIPGGGGGNVLMLYVGEKDGDQWAYKNPELTEEYASYDEAKAAITAASILKFKVAEEDAFLYPVRTAASVEGNREIVNAIVRNEGSEDPIYLWDQTNRPPLE